MEEEQQLCDSIKTIVPAACPPSSGSSSSSQQQQQQQRQQRIREEEVSLPQWSELLPDICVSIAKTLSPDPTDYVRFGAVCKAWKSAASIENYPPAHRMPLLLLDEDDTIPNPAGIRRFFSLSECKTYELAVPEACGRMCCTSTGGYILTLGTDLKMHLVDPWTRDKIRLPSMNKFNVNCLQGRDWPAEHKRNFFIWKVCLSWSSSPLKRRIEKNEDCTALAFYGAGRRPAYVKLDGKYNPRTRWTTIWCKWWPFNDAVFYKGRFHAVNHRGDVVVLDLEKLKGEMIAPTPSSEDECTPHGSLVESNGDLLQVQRFRFPLQGEAEAKLFEETGRLSYKTFYFKVFKMVAEEGPAGGKWEAVKSLGGRSLFVGLNNTFCVEASSLMGCKENCIYFTDDYRLGILDGRGHDMGVYNMEDGSITPLPFPGELLSWYSPPLWIAPCVWWRGQQQRQ